MGETCTWWCNVSGCLLTLFRRRPSFALPICLSFTYKYPKTILPESVTLASRQCEKMGGEINTRTTIDQRVREVWLLAQLSGVCSIILTLRLLWLISYSYIDWLFLFASCFASIIKYLLRNSLKSIEFIMKWDEYKHLIRYRLAYKFSHRVTNAANSVCAMYGGEVPTRKCSCVGNCHLKPTKKLPPSHVSTGSLVQTKWNILSSQSVYHLFLGLSRMFLY